MKKRILISIILFGIIFNLVNISASVVINDIEGYTLMSSIIEEGSEGKIYSTEYSIDYNGETYIYDVVITNLGKNEAIITWKDLKGETKSFDNVNYKIVGEQELYYIFWVSKNYLIKIGPVEEGLQEEFSEELMFAYGKKYPSETKLQRFISWFKKLFGGGDYEEEDYAEDRISFLRYNKCISLCPVLEENSVRYFDSSCTIYCQKYSKEISKEYSELVQKEPEELQEDFIYCWNNFRDDLNFDYVSCFIKYFEKNKDLVNLSDFILEDY